MLPPGPRLSPTSYLSEMKRRIIFRDQDIVDFCRATHDINEVHDPGYMAGIGKRAIVPGMFAFSAAINLASRFLKEEGNTIRVFFNTLLSSGDFADLVAEPGGMEGDRFCRIYAINHKDTLTTGEEHTRIFSAPVVMPMQEEGIVRSLPLETRQIAEFTRLVGAGDPEVAGYLFAISYASQALYKSIAGAVTETEFEIDDLINHSGRISPFYQSLEISLPRPIPPLVSEGELLYRTHFVREKFRKIYLAFLQCEQGGEVLFRSRYRLMAIPDAVILRMAKDIPRR